MGTKCEQEKSLCFVLVSFGRFRPFGCGAIHRVEACPEPMPAAERNPQGYPQDIGGKAIAVAPDPRFGRRHGTVIAITSPKPGLEYPTNIEQR